jgi:hypothetical protein
VVTGVNQLRARFNKVPNIVRVELERQIAKEADKLVTQMNLVRPNDAIEVAWTWGENPKGSLRIGQAYGKEYGKVSATIYATAKTKKYPNGFPMLAVWFEFGTSGRVQKTTGRYSGIMSASPFFYPVFRASKGNIQSNLKRAVTRGMKKA